MSASARESQQGLRRRGVLMAIGSLGALTLGYAGRLFRFAGGMSVLLGAMLGDLWVVLVLRRSRFRGEHVLSQMVRVGVRAIGIIVLVGLAIGVILPLQMYPKLDEFGQAEQIATVNAIAVFRELGPLLTAIVLSGFAGASIAAELGSMVTAEEVEALEAMGLKPVNFLVMPRLVATVLMMLMLTVIADVVMIGSGWFTGVRLGIDPDLYYHLTTEAVDLTGFGTGLVKAGIFGVLVGLIACYLGLSVKPWQGSEGVGRATTATVVYSIVAIIGADAVFTIIFYAYGLFS